jgi:hypothetical protein
MHDSFTVMRVDRPASLGMPLQLLMQRMSEWSISDTAVPSAVVIWSPIGYHSMGDGTFPGASGQISVPYPRWLKIEVYAIT